MSIAEYIAAFVAIMIGLALADLATSLQRLLRSGRRVKWDILTPASAVLATAFIINVWWAMFGALNALRTISVGAFVPELVALLLLFSLASSALPDEVGPDGVDLASYYRDNQRWFWGLFTLYIVWVTAVIAARGLASELPAGALARAVVPNLVLASLTVTLAIARRRWIHVLLILALLAVTGLAWLPQELAGTAK